MAKNFKCVTCSNELGYDWVISVKGCACHAKCDRCVEITKQTGKKRGRNLKKAK